MSKSPLRWLVAIVVVLLATSVLASCSDDDDDDTTTTSTTATTTPDESTTSTTDAAATPEDVIEQAIRDTAVGGLRNLPADSYTVEDIRIVAVDDRGYAAARLVPASAGAELEESTAVLEELPTGWVVIDVATSEVGCGITPPAALEALGLPTDCPPAETSTTATPAPSFPPPVVEDEAALCDAYDQWVEVEVQRRAIAQQGGSQLDDANQRRTDALDQIATQLGGDAPAEITSALDLLQANSIEASDADGVPEDVRTANRLVSSYLTPVCA